MLYMWNICAPLPSSPSLSLSPAKGQPIDHTFMFDFIHLIISCGFIQVRRCKYPSSARFSAVPLEGFLSIPVPQFPPEQ